MKKDSRTLKHQGELYDLLVDIRRVNEDWSKKKHVGEPARGLLAVLLTIAETAADAHRSGSIIDVHVDVYTPTTLPGWSVDLDGELLPPPWLTGEGDQAWGDE